MRAYGTVRQSSHLLRVYCVLCAGSCHLNRRAVQRHQDSGACAGATQQGIRRRAKSRFRICTVIPQQFMQQFTDKASAILQTWSSRCRIMRLHHVLTTSVYLAACQNITSGHMCVLMLCCCCAVVCAGASCAAVGCSSAARGPQRAGGRTTQLCGAGGVPTSCWANTAMFGSRVMLEPHLLLSGVTLGFIAPPPPKHTHTLL